MSVSTQALVHGPGNSARGRRWKSPTIALAVLGIAAQSCLTAAPAGATLSGNGVSPGKNITVFHNIDMVAVFGYGPVGEMIEVEVIGPNGIKGRAAGKAVATPEGPGLEVNHGVDGTPVPGDCWIGSAPNVRPGDRIRVTSNGVVNEVTVDDIELGTPKVDTFGHVVVPGHAKRGTDGVAIPATALDSAEFRDDSGKYRATPDAVEGVDDLGNFVLRYKPPFAGDRNRNGLSEAQRKQALLGDGHAAGFGHTDPLPRESMLVDGTGDTTGHAAGCGGTPAEPAEPGDDPFTPDPTPQPGDAVKPYVASHTPIAGATGVSRNANVTVKFSELVRGVNGSTFKIKRDGASASSAARVTYSRRTGTAKLNPSSTLRAGTKYIVTVTSGVKDAAGNALTEYTWSFKTA